jgi:hypothetical protein
VNTSAAARGTALVAMAGPAATAYMTLSFSGGGTHYLDDLEVATS